MIQNKTTISTPVPQTLSALIDLAVTEAEDLPIAEYHPRSNVWYTVQPDEDGMPVCHICLAGAVIAAKAENLRGVPVSPYQVAGSWRHALFALDSVRQNRLIEAFEMMHGIKDTALPTATRQALEGIETQSLIRTETFQSWDEFHHLLTELKRVAIRLRAVGL